MKAIRIAAAQTSEYLEDMEAALSNLVAVAARAQSAGVALLCFPEGYLQGYLTDEYAAQKNALDLSSAAFDAILKRFPKTGPIIVLGLIEVENGRLFNTAIVVHRGSLIGKYRKIHLLKSEQCFDAGSDVSLFEVEGFRFGINICYDTNFPEIAQKIAALGGALIVCPTNNMLRRDAAEAYKDLHNTVRGERCVETGLWLISADVTGERDDRISFGPTAVIDPTGRVAAQLPLGETGLLVFDLPCRP